MISSPEMPPLAIDFFSKFARFEYALKELADYRYVDNRGVVANWDEFAKSPKIEALFRRLERDTVANYIIEHPPRKRVVRDGILDWSEAPQRPDNMVELCKMVRQVRNNLFHGDKGHAGSERDTNLLTACIRIMDTMLETDADVRQHYEFRS